MKHLVFLLLFAIGSPIVPEAFGQYFGRNKPKYDQFDFRVLQTPNFEIYHYLEDKERLHDLARQSELWYQNHATVLRHAIEERNPLIFYSDHADFQQTNAITSNIGVGTGGVTEGLRNRLIMPLTISNQKTFHVLGHELVHAFQFDMILGNDSMSFENLANIPLFIIEGKAEYLSRGRDDPFTAMWMRDAVLRDEVPSITDMNNPKYFPYRYGHAFWAYLTGMYGDAVIKPLFMAIANYGMREAFPRVLQKSMEEVSNDWIRALKEHYQPILEGGDFSNVGRSLITEETAGRMNVSPAISPNGRYVVFLSEKDLFTADLYLANASNGEIIRKLASSLRYADVDHIDAIESAGTWSPDSRTFAYVGFSKGRNVLITVEVESGRRLQTYKIPELSAFSNPSWSPNGNLIALSGLVDGRPDLFFYNLQSGSLVNVTNDRFSYLLPSWSMDGDRIAVTTDRLSMQNGMTNGKWVHNLAIIDVESAEITDLEVFPGSDNFNPVFDSGDNIWFLSDQDGFRDIYQLSSGLDSLFRKTRVATGVSGVTSFAPAITISRRIDRIMYTLYEEGNYTILSARQNAFLTEQIDPLQVDMVGAGQLPVIGRIGPFLSDAGLSNLVIDDFTDTLQFEPVPYDSKFALIAASQSMGGGVGVGSGAMGSGTFLGGGVQLLFSDILGDHQLFTTLFLNGEIYDIGLMASYLNRENRINWGVSLSHVPYRTGYSSWTFEPLPDGDPNSLFPVLRTDLLRIFEQQLSFMIAYPFNVNTRVEAGLGTSYRFFRLDRYRDFYSQAGFYLGRDRQQIKLDGDLDLGGFIIRKTFTHNVGTALVGDNSFFGMTAPLQGYRYRLGYNLYFGGYDFHAVTADARKYFWLNPLSLSVRAFHFSRIGKDATAFFPIYIGQMGMVRGYDIGSRELFDRYGLSVSQVTGSKVLLSSFEVRLPFTGPERLALIPSRFLFSDLNLFFDIGVAFNEYNQIVFNEPGFNESAVLMSAGLSWRINLFGAMVIEPYYAFPIREGSRGTFGLNFLPGW